MNCHMACIGDTMTDRVPYGTPIWHAIRAAMVRDEKKKELVLDTVKRHESWAFKPE